MKRLFLIWSYLPSQRLIRMQKCFNFEFLIMHYELFLCVPAIAVGLSAISLLAPLSLHSQRMPLQSLTLWDAAMKSSR